MRRPSLAESLVIVSQILTARSSRFLEPVYGEQARSQDALITALGLTAAIPLRRRHQSTALAALLTLAYPVTAQVLFRWSDYLGPRIGPIATLAIARLPALTLALSEPSIWSLLVFLPAPALSRVLSVRHG